MSDRCDGIRNSIVLYVNLSYLQLAHEEFSIKASMASLILSLMADWFGAPGAHVRRRPFYNPFPCCLIQCWGIGPGTAWQSKKVAIGVKGFCGINTVIYEPELIKNQKVVSALKVTGTFRGPIGNEDRKNILCRHHIFSYQTSIHYPEYLLKFPG